VDEAVDEYRFCAGCRQEIERDGLLPPIGEEPTVGQYATYVMDDGTTGLKLLTTRAHATSLARWGWIAAAVIAALLGLNWLLSERAASIRDERTQRVGATCEDGSFSAATGNGACSGHGGVDRWEYDDTQSDGYDPTLDGPGP
jgi:hypothetical protein